MVVLASRKEAVRWQIAITKYISERGYKIGALVAFSGDVNDPESGADPFTENSKTLNPLLNGRDIREAFAGEDYHLLLVANKFPDKKVHLWDLKTGNEVRNFFGSTQAVISSDGRYVLTAAAARHRSGSHPLA